MQTVRNIIESKQKTFNFIDADALVIEALTLMQSVNLSYVVVMKNEEYRGIFSEKEYARNVILKGGSSTTTKVGEVMATNVPVVDYTDSVEHCMQILSSHKARYLLAFDGQHFAGVITINDLLRQLLMNRDEVFDRKITEDLLDSNENDLIF
ncbi:CBS domain-containing protein [Ferruginibacter lapsinanis]|uniref:CBS domain-containing protein n=1 Tax=Ferruginibacter lapsinanis TaxID=563172 RepID=UPI001E59E026|nr:CBS domain-containing protein [Ferruginibacter lapsinanis]UEG48815.1 CBS domain-containing protein [Ferruginibacter lapsinanis]